MKICLISDTHNHHNHLNLNIEADVIIHSGDFTSMGREHEIVNFFKWFSKLEQFKHKIIVAGNHDILFEKNSSLAKSLIPKNIIYLEDFGINIDGFNFYGTPVQNRFGNGWAFNRDENVLWKHWEAIPSNTDILITHMPPYGIYDIASNSHQGSNSLYYEIKNRIRPKLHVYGHIHENNGIIKEENIIFVNASICDDRNICINEPIVIVIE